MASADDIFLRPNRLAKHNVTATVLSCPFCPCQKGGMSKDNPFLKLAALRNHAMNDNSERQVTIITGRVWRRKGGDSEGVHVMLVAPDDDSAVRTALNALTKEGYVEAELDQIGDMQEVPDDGPHLSAYQGAIEGEVSIVTFQEMI